MSKSVGFRAELGGLKTINNTEKILFNGIKTDIIVISEIFKRMRLKNVFNLLKFIR